MINAGGDESTAPTDELHTEDASFGVGDLFLLWWT